MGKEKFNFVLLRVTVPSDGDKAIERKVPSVADELGDEERGGRAAPTVPGLADGQIRESYTTEDACTHGQ